MTEPTLSDRLRARADYLDTVVLDDVAHRPLVADTVVLLRTAASTLDSRRAGIVDIWNPLTSSWQATPAAPELMQGERLPGGMVALTVNSYEALFGLRPFQEALRLLGFGDALCTSTDPVDYAKRWTRVAAGLRPPRAAGPRRLTTASAVNIREPVDVAAQLTNMLETALQEAKALQAILDRGNS